MQIQFTVLFEQVRLTGHYVTIRQILLLYKDLTLQVGLHYLRWGNVI